jgi:hypothetical protein
VGGETGYNKKMIELTTVGLLLMLLGAATLAAVLALYIYVHNEFE